MKTPVFKSSESRTSNNDGTNDHMVYSNVDSRGNYHHHNVDDNNLKDSVK